MTAAEGFDCVAIDDFIVIADILCVCGHVMGRERRGKLPVLVCINAACSHRGRVYHAPTTKLREVIQL